MILKQQAVAAGALLPLGLKAFFRAHSSSQLKALLSMESGASDPALGSEIGSEGHDHAQKLSEACPTCVILLVGCSFFGLQEIFILGGLRMSGMSLIIGRSNHAQRFLEAMPSQC